MWSQLLAEKTVLRPMLLQTRVLLALEEQMRPGDQTQGNDARGVYVNAVFADPSAVVFVNYAQDGVRQSCDRPERGIR